MLLDLTRPLFADPPAIKDTRVLAVLVVAFLAVLVPVAHGDQLAGWLVFPVLALLVLAGVLAGTSVVRSASVATARPDLVPVGTPASAASGAATPVPGRSDKAPEPDQAVISRSVRPAAMVRASALGVVPVLTAVRAYVPVLRYDWPQIRGLEHFSYTVMAEQMLAHGGYRPT